MRTLIFVEVQMNNEDIVIDLCHNENPDQLEQLVSASVNYWEGKGYSRVSNVAGPDMLRGYKSAISAGAYSAGATIFSLNADTILIFQKQA